MMIKTDKWIAICEGMTGKEVCTWSDGEGTFGFCLEVKSLKIAQKVQELIGEIVVFSTIPSQTWEGHDTLLDLRKATKKDFNRYRSLLKNDTI